MRRYRDEAEGLTDCTQCGHARVMHTDDYHKPTPCVVCDCPKYIQDPLAGLWSIEQVAEYWNVSPSRARAILAEAGVKSGYDPEEIYEIPRSAGQGARADLNRAAN